MALLEDDSGMEVTLASAFDTPVHVQYVSFYANAALMVLLFPLCQLLVNSKIISLDLPVKDVYKKIWCPEGEVCGYFPKYRNVAAMLSLFLVFFFLLFVIVFYFSEGGWYTKVLFIKYLFYRVNQ